MIAAIETRSASVIASKATTSLKTGMTGSHPVMTAPGVKRTGSDIQPLTVAKDRLCPTALVVIRLAMLVICLVTGKGIRLVHPDHNVVITADLPEPAIKRAPCYRGFCS